MSGFSVNVLTTHGQALIAQATSGNQLTFSNMRVSASSMTAAQAQAAVVTDFSVDFGPIKSASASGSVCRVTASYQNPSSSAMTLKSFALCGRLSGSLSDDVIAVLSDAAAEVVLAPHGSAGDTCQIGFSLTISNAATVTVQVTDVGSASLSDLDRFVSCHKAGNELEGEEQAIWGYKNFRQAIRPEAGLEWYRIDVGNFIKVVAERTGPRDSHTKAVHQVFVMTDETNSRSCLMECVYDGSTEKMTLTCDADRVELPKLAISPDYVSSATSVSVGQVLLIHVKVTSLAATQIFAGMTISSTFFSIHTARMKTDHSWEAGDTDLSAYTFIAMSDTVSLPQNATAVVLAQRRF